MGKLTAASAVVLAVTVITVSPASAAPAQPPAGATISVVTANGSGCPAGTTAVSQAPDNTLQVTYRQFAAQTGGTATPGLFRQNCQLNLSVQVPAGYTFALSQLDYHGHAYLPAGATGALTLSYYYAGLPGTVYRTYNFTGSVTNYWQVSDQPPVAYAPCGFTGTFNVNASLQVDTGTDPAEVSTLTMDSTDISPSHLSLQPCQAAGLSGRHLTR